jgi:hypothetical protein
MKGDTMTEPNNVWIELKRPDPELPQAERDALGDKRAPLCSMMIERLGGTADYCFWRPKTGYCFGGPMGFIEAVDNGYWFNLDFLGRTVTEA